MASLKDYLLPHKGNDYHPSLFKGTAIAVLIGVVVIIEGAYLVDTKIAQDHTSFLASVLPAALLDLTNADREKNNIAPLIHDSELDQAAQLKANDMAAKGYFAHTSPEGKSPWYWLDEVGYRYTYAGENLAINFDDSSAVEDAWMNSPTHRANIVKPQYTRVGYAVAQGVYEGKETTFVVQEFAATPSDGTLTKPVKQENSVATAIKRVANIARVPDETPVVSEATNTATTSEPAVLGSQASESITPDADHASFLKNIAASPHRATTYALSGLAALMAILLLIALFAHANVRYLEVLGSGLVVIIFALSVLFYNASHALAPVVSEHAAATQASP